MSKNLLKSNHPDIELLKGCEITAGHYMCVLFVQRRTRRFLKERRLQRQRIREERERQEYISM
jgi:hypothetical protein